MKNIIIVESPSKSKTIESYMGSDYKVLSSKGHIRDLATSGQDGLGINIKDGFTPIYKILKEKQKLVNELKDECKNANVYLATDPDREGEAISFHLAQVLNLDMNSLNRIEFNEVTKPAILEAFSHPRKIDKDLVSSQETRRMLDRIIGFKLSKLLQSKIKSQAAGRVQSAALKMIVDLEKEIISFIPENYYEIEALFDGFKLKLDTYLDKKADIKDKALALSIKSDLKPEYTVSKVVEKEVTRESKTAYTTSMLQQDAANKLNFNSVKTMRTAQALYEGKSIGDMEVGLITYMRTDSTHLSNLFVDEANEHIKSTYGLNYLGKIKHKTQKLAQEAHEAIRPTSLKRTPESMKKYLSLDEYKIYNLIYVRALASLMAPAVFLNKKAIFDNTNTTFSISGSRRIFDGYQILKEKNDDEVSTEIPNFKEGETYIANSVEILELETKPKSRYTEATLIKDMEENGIGRPSTYAQTLINLTNRKYVSIKEKKLYPTEQGILTIDKLDEYFSSIINVEYTAKMELGLDKISKGELDGTKELGDFYAEFIPIFENAKKNMETLKPEKTGEICPVCGGDLVKKEGKFGAFVACSNYPKCTYIKENEDKEKPFDTGIICPTCKNGHMMRKTASRGRNAGNYFYSCSNYPKCKTVFNDEPTNEICPKCNAIMLKDKTGNLICSKDCDNKSNIEEVICPKCGKGHLVERTAKKGANAGNKFYACSNYPKCKNIYSFPPTNIKCSKCGAIMLNGPDGLICSNTKCE